MRKFYGKVKCGILMAGLVSVLSVSAPALAAEPEETVISDESGIEQESEKEKVTVEDAVDAQLAAAEEIKQQPAADLLSAGEQSVEQEADAGQSVEEEADEEEADAEEADAEEADEEEADAEEADAEEADEEEADAEEADAEEADAEEADATDVEEADAKEAVAEETDAEEADEEEAETEKSEAAAESAPVKNVTASKKGKTAAASTFSGKSTIQSNDTAEAETEEIKEGFFQDGDYKYYRGADGKIVKNQIVTVGEKQYYLDSKGRLVVSSNFVLDDFGYRANAKGVLSVKSGWLEIGSKWYFTKANGALCKEMWVSNTYFIGEDGTMVTNTVLSWDNSYYYIDKKGVWQKKEGWITYKSKKYYIKSNGLLGCNEPLKIDGRWYCFGTDAIPLKSQIVKINETLYYLAADGGSRTKSGWIKFKKKWYFTEKTGALRVNALITNGEKEKYYVGSDGAMVTKKIVKVGGKMYYAKVTGLFRVKKGWIRVEGKRYLVNKGGAFRTNAFVHKSKKKVYYLGSDGQFVKGTIVIHEDKAYYIKKNGLVKFFKGWLKINDIWYYGLGQDGLKRNAIQTTGGKSYFFGSNGQMVVSDGVVADGKGYIADENGVLKLKKGWFKSGGKWYRASKKGNIYADRFLKIGAKQYYFDKSGALQQGGFFYVGSKLYYANKSGVIRKKSGWFKLDDKWYFSTAKGEFYHSISKKIKGKRYYFDANGVWTKNADYYDPTGISDTSWKEINGRRYHLDKNGNKDSWLGIDVSAWNDEIDWDKVAADGIDFAFIRVGGRFGKTGEIYDDSMGVENIKKATEAGIPVGVYFFTQAINEKEAIEEAEYTLEKIKGLNVTLPIVIDSENMSGGRHGKITPQKRTNVIKAFCETVTNAGYNAMYYAGMAWCVDGFVDVSQLTEYMHWCAQYWIRNQCDDYGVPYQIWQYSDSGSVDGIKGNVDMNIWYRVH